MSKQIPLKPIAAAFVGVGLLAGCHSGSTVGATGAGPTSSGTASAPTGSAARTAAVAAPPGNGLGGSSAPTAGPAPAGFITRVCTAITIAHAQAPVRATVTKIDFDSNNEDPNGIFQCNIDEAHQALSVKVEPEDSAKANYTADVAAENVPGTPWPGVGDVAVWTQALHNPPDFYAHKGNVTCEVTSGDIRELSLTNDASIIDGGVATPIAAAYAAKLGAICTDVFVAIG
jgi:hypothetical protein